MNTSFLGALCFILLINVIGTQAVCLLDVSYRSKVPNYRMTASSEWDANHGPEFGRLGETTTTAGNPIAVWAAKKNVVGQWIQVDLGRPTKVAGVVTQGRGTGNYQQWVTSYTVGCMIDDDMLVIADKNGKAKVFQGNRDKVTKVTNLFPAPMTCRYVRIYPQTYHGHISMRFDVLGTDC